MKKKPKISIIIRTKNEERWITSCLKAVFAQDRKDFEVILVDNDSTDNTVRKAREFPVRIVSIKKYLPGLALNAGIKQAKGEYAVCLSGHCVPVNNQWLSNLLRNFEEKGIAGVYGRQEPMAFSSDRDKRDLLITFGLDRRVQVKDSFFHNANSMIPMKLWRKHPFDAEVTNIEDRLWAETMIQEGCKIVYEPEASVYHWHGIHHDGDPQRAAKTTRILEGIDRNRRGKAKRHPRIDHLNVVAVIPMKGVSPKLGSKPLISYTIERARQAKHVDRVVVSTDTKATAALAKKLGAEAPFVRSKEYSKEFVGTDKVLQVTLEEMEKRDILPDLLVLLEPTFPFRSPGLIDRLVEEAVAKGFDSVLAVRREFNSLWTEEEGRIARLDEGFVPRQYKRPFYLGVKGLGCVTHPSFVRDGSLLGPKVGLFEVDEPYASVEVRDKRDFPTATKILERWWKGAKK